MIKQFNNLNDFEEAFPDEATCIDHFRALRWPDGMSCPHCGSMERVYDLKKGVHKCGDCRKKFTVRHDSIFGDSKLPLRTWFKAIFLMTSHKKGISSCQLARDLGVTQKTGWFILNRIREASRTEEFNRPLEGTFEADEMFVGGKERFKHMAKRNPIAIGKGSVHTKMVVFGLLHRGGDLHLEHIKKIDRKTINGIVAKRAAKGATVYSDEAQHYKWMKAGGYKHDLVRHRLGEYVRGDVTSNRIEGAFGHFKRAVTGVYHKVSDDHVNRYLTMFAWRWNRRTMSEGERVNALLKGTKNRRITYRQLIGKE